MRSNDTLLSIDVGGELLAFQPRVAQYAALRIFSEPGLDFERVAFTFGVEPTLLRRRGEPMGPNGSALLGDLWMYRPGLEESEPLYRHVDALWRVLQPHVEFVRGLKLVANVQLLLGYSSNLEETGLSLPSASLEVFRQLDLPLELSFIALPR